MSGLQTTQNNVRLDGSNYNNRFFGSAPVLPNPDTLREFTVQSANYSARTAGAGALVELSTRSGTNVFRFAVRRSNSHATRRSTPTTRRFDGQHDGS